MLTATKTVRFDAAHMLSGHDGQCRNLHGHSYRVDVAVAQRPEESGDMVMDFKEIKRVCEEEIVARFDHSFMYDETSQDEREIAELLERRSLRTAPMPYRTTAENLARLFYSTLKARMPGLASVKVWETTDSVAEFHR